MSFHTLLIKSLLSSGLLITIYFIHIIFFTGKSALKEFLMGLLFYIDGN